MAHWLRALIVVERPEFDSQPPHGGSAPTQALSMCVVHKCTCRQNTTTDKIIVIIDKFMSYALFKKKCRSRLDAHCEPYVCKSLDLSTRNYWPREGCP